MGLFNRVEGYAKKRGLGSAVNVGWRSIRSSTSTFEKPKLSQKLLNAFWHGPRTETERRALFTQNVAPMFESLKEADEVAARLKIMGTIMLVLGFALGISAVFFDGFLYKFGAIMGFLILGISATAHIHRAEQIRQRAVFGIKHLFF